MPATPGRGLCVLSSTAPLDELSLPLSTYRRGNLPSRNYCINRPHARHPDPKRICSTAPRKGAAPSDQGAGAFVYKCYTGRERWQFAICARFPTHHYRHAALMMENERASDDRLRVNRCFKRCFASLIVEPIHSPSSPIHYRAYLFVYCPGAPSTVILTRRSSSHSTLLYCRSFDLGFWLRRRLQLSSLLLCCHRQYLRGVKTKGRHAALFGVQQ